jgi:hypothetical protein
MPEPAPVTIATFGVGMMFSLFCFSFYYPRTCSGLCAVNARRVATKQSILFIEAGLLRGVYHRAGEAEAVGSRRRYFFSSAFP